MSMRIAYGIVGMLALAACGPRVRPEPPAAPVAAPRFGIHAAVAERIDYETRPCFGRCPVYRLSVGRDGRGVFTGIANTAVRGERAFAVSAAEYRAFAAALAPHRPDRDVRIVPGSGGCKNAPTDLPGVTVRWNRGRIDQATLDFYYGCARGGFAAMAQALGNAPDRLPPLEALIGPRP